MSDPHICIQCAEEGPTCCQLDPGHEEFCFPLSEAERGRILDELDGDTGAFAQMPNSRAFVENVKKLFPGEEELIELLFHKNKFHFRLATEPDGRCKLLGKEGCRLSREARPYYCRLFPLWLTASSMNIFTSTRCLAQRTSKTKPMLLACLDTSQAEVKRLHGGLRLAWGLPPKKGMPIPEDTLSKLNRK